MKTGNRKLLPRLARAIGLLALAAGLAALAGVLWVRHRLTADDLADAVCAYPTFHADLKYLI